MQPSKASLGAAVLFFFLFFLTGRSSGNEDIVLERSARQSSPSIYFALRYSGSPTVQPISEGFKICPSELSDGSTIIECVSPQSTVADLYVNSVFLTRDYYRPYTIPEESSFPTGSVRLWCYTEFWFLEVNGVFECEEDISQGPEIPIPSSNTPNTPSTQIPSGSSSIPLVGSGSFHLLNVLSGSPTPRKEACTVLVAGKLYLIGGRDGKPVNYYDTLTRTWHATQNFGPADLHHCGCVAYQDRYVYIPTAWYGQFPYEGTYQEMFIYDTVTDSWSTAPGLGPRSRGAASVSVYNGRIWVAFGNRGGHGAHAISLGEFDSYDFNTQTWSSLPSAPDPRDHVGGGAIIGNLLCVGGGRDGGKDNFWGTPVLPVNCFNFNTYAWERRANLPRPRGGVGNAATCQGFLMIAGGEGRQLGSTSGGDAYSWVDLYDPATDSFLQPITMSIKRHGMSITASDCSCGNIYYVSGAAGLGDGPLQTTTEVWSPDGNIRYC